MTKSFWLIVNKKGSVRAVKTYSSLAWNEVAIDMTITLPSNYFDRPQLSATVTVPDGGPTPEIPADVAEEARLAIEQATGLEVRLSINSPEESGN